MPNLTLNYKFKKPIPNEDVADITVINENFDTADNELKKSNDSIKNLENNKQNKEDSTLKTLVKTIVGGINELYDELIKKATKTQLGRIKVGNNLTVDEDGTLHGNPSYTHPTGDGNNHIPVNGASGNFLKWLSSGAAQWANITWSDITGKPSTYPPDTHTHDDRYYTENEINTKLDGKANTNHTHDYASSSHTHTPSSIGAVNKTGDTLTGAINFANNTWNKFGDDVSIGDCNQSGKIGIKGLNGATGIYFYPYSGSTVNTISIDGAGNLTISGTTIGTFKGNISGNSTTATTLQTARTLTIGSTGKNFNGGANLAWSLAEIGVYSKAETDEKFKNFCPYSVGEILLTTNSENPATKYLGTTWQKIEGRFLLGTSGSGASKSTGGSNSKTIAQANLPNVKLTVNSFSLSRGTMDIIGKFNAAGLYDTNIEQSGALYNASMSAKTTSWTYTSSNNSTGIGFQASRNWTGNTNSVSPQTSALGSGSALDVTPAYYSVHMWLRLT